MKNLIILASLFLVCSRVCNVIALNLPGPRVYVVTPASRLQNDEVRSAPFYYRNWMRRMDNAIPAQNSTTTSTTAVPKVKTPDLIFAEFESDSNDGMKKSIRKLLEKEKVVPKTTTTTTSQPIYVPDEESDKATRVVDYGLPFNVKQEEKSENEPSDNINYFSMYNNLYRNPATTLFLPSTTSTPKTITTTSMTTPEASKIENVWHIIDSEKNNQYSDKWEEVSVDSETGKNDQETVEDGEGITEEKGDQYEFDENFALPGLGSTPGNGAENESRAIRTEPQIRFPYVSLKPFQLKLNKKPVNSIVPDQKKGSNFMMNLDNFHDLKNPVRGEAYDINPMRDHIDRYNPAQPYLPHTDYGSKNSKQNSMSTPPKATANLIPPPPPPVPKVTGNDFPALTSYESFPPYASPSFDSAPAPPPSAPKPPTSMFSAPAVDNNAHEDSDSYSDNGPLMNVGYQYRPPALPMQQFIPTVPPISEPFKGYSYDKPPMSPDAPVVSMDDKPDFHGYHYNKPEEAPPQSDPIPPSNGDDAPPTYGHDSDLPELIFQKNQGHGFPSDFPDHHYFDDHDHFYHEHHHHTTTTTTEMPRVNRYSYYYLGKKLYYLPLYFSVYFIVYVGALIIKAVLRHKIVYPNSWRPNGTTASFFSKRSVDKYLANDNLHEITGKVTHALATAAEKYLSNKSKKN